MPQMLPKAPQQARFQASARLLVEVGASAQSAPEAGAQCRWADAFQGRADMEAQADATL